MTSRTLPRALAVLVWLAVLALGAPATTVAQQPENTPEALTTQHPWIGQPAPDIELMSTSGETITLDDYRGKKVLILHFAASW
jgi:cytochrome oxidase Cu insertion factor (SCO1/SenC/PrrC family)